MSKELAEAQGSELDNSGDSSLGSDYVTNSSSGLIRTNWKKILLYNKTTFISALFLFLTIVVLLVTPLLPLLDPAKLDTSNRLLSPFESWTHPLGTDDLGRDILSRILWGGRVSLVAGLSAAAISVGIGSFFGLIAGYSQSVGQHIVMRVVDVMMAFPPLILAIAIVGALGPELKNAVIAAGVIGIPLYARVIRSIVLVEKETDYVLATRALGAAGRRIVLRHITPATFPTLSVFVTLDIGYKIIVTAGMSFLGLGSQPPASDWGAMLADGRSFLTTAPHLVTVPGVSIFLVVLALNLLGDCLRDILDPRISIESTRSR